MDSRAGLAVGITAGIGSRLHDWVSMKPLTFHALPSARSFELHGPVRSVDTVSGVVSAMSEPGRRVGVESSRHHHRAFFDLHGRCTLEECAEGRRPLSVGGRLRRAVGATRIPIDFELDDFDFTLTHRIRREFLGDQISLEQTWHRVIYSGKVQAIHEVSREFSYDSGRIVEVQETEKRRKNRFSYCYDDKGRVTDIVPDSFLFDRQLSFEYGSGNRCVRISRKEKNGRVLATHDFERAGDRIKSEVIWSALDTQPGAFSKHLFDEVGLLVAELRGEKSTYVRRKKIFDYARDNHGNWVVQRMADSSIQGPFEGRNARGYQDESSRLISYS